MQLGKLNLLQQKKQRPVLLPHWGASLGNQAQKSPKGCVVAVELVRSASLEWFDGLTSGGGRASVAWAKKEFELNVIGVVCPTDERSPRIHVMVVLTYSQIRKSGCAIFFE